MDNFITGAAGGCAAITFTHPLDTLRIQRQAQLEKKVFALMKEQSLRTLYRGLPSPLTGAFLSNSLLFGVEGFAKAHFCQSISSPYGQKTVSGGVAGFASALILTPIELVKIQMQNLGSKHRDTFACARHIARNDGILGLARGFWITALRETPACAIYFVSFEYLKDILEADKGAQKTKTFTSGGVAGVLSWIFTYPIDVIKTRQQASVTPISLYNCLRQTMSSPSKEWMFRGLTITMFRAFLFNGACFLVEDLTRAKFFET